jgi:putative hemolysin
MAVQQELWASKNWCGLFDCIDAGVSRLELLVVTVVLRALPACGALSVLPGGAMSVLPGGALSVLPGGYRCNPCMGTQIIDNQQQHLSSRMMSLVNCCHSTLFYRHAVLAAATSDVGAALSEQLPEEF